MCTRCRFYPAATFLPLTFDAPAWRFFVLFLALFGLRVAAVAPDRGAEDAAALCPAATARVPAFADRCMRPALLKALPVACPRSSPRSMQFWASGSARQLYAVHLFRRWHASQHPQTLRVLSWANALPLKAVAVSSRQVLLLPATVGPAPGDFSTGAVEGPPACCRRPSAALRRGLVWEAPFRVAPYLHSTLLTLPWLSVSTGCDGSVRHERRCVAASVTTNLNR